MATHKEPATNVATTAGASVPDVDDSCACSRRDFFEKLGVASAAVAGLGTAVFGYEFLSPKVLYEPSPVINAGKPENYAPQSVTLLPEAGVYVVRALQGVYALGAVCSHLGCLTIWAPEQGTIACPCHGSKFSTDGTKIEGPAPRPLPRLKAWLSEDGDLMVDRNTSIAAHQFVRV